MQNKYILKAKTGEYVIYLHNGYAEFSYGMSVDPITLSFCEYNILMNFISKLGFQNEVFEFENSNEYDFRIPYAISEKIGFSLLTLSPVDCCIYTSEENKRKRLIEKEKLIQILKN